MNIYKVAQTIQFANPNNVKTKINRMRDPEFSAYLSVLAQVHEELQQGIELEDAVADSSDAAHAKAIITLVNEIGISNFMNLDFSKISAALTALRPVKETIPVTPSKIPGVPAGTSQAVKPDAINVQEFLRMDSESRIEYFENLDYPENVRNKAEMMLENMKAIDYAYSDKDTPRSTKEFYEKELISAMISLLEMASGSFQEEEPDEFEETPGVRKFKFDRKKPASGDEDDIEQVYNESNASASSHLEATDVFNTEVLREESFKAFVAKSNNPYIDFSVAPPTFNEDMDLAFGNFLKKIDDILEKASRGASTSLKQEFNDVIFAIKAADVMTYEELKKHMKDVPKEFKTQYANIEHRFLNECPSKKILNPDHFETLFFASIALSAPKLIKLFLSDDMEVLEKEALKNTHIQEADFDTIKEKMELFAKTQFRSKADAFFQLTSRYKQKNFIDRVGLSWDIVFNRVIKKVYTQGPAYNLRPCPTCYKWVPWSYSKQAKKLNQEVDGFRIRLVSFLTNDRDKPKITLEELNSRKWPAPPSTIYSEDREKQLVIKYAKEGERSWEEIQALLASNNPELHEEGLHRRTGALFSAGGVFLTSKDVLIKNLVNECPFDTSGKAGSLCGVSFTPNIPTTALSKKMSLQPQWNGSKDIAESNVKNILIEDLWQDKELYEKARRLQSGGFKFSKINLACTCRIAQLDSLSSYKHSNIAISKAGVSGSKGFVYPTQPNGLLDTNLEDGTLSYMVCGAPTSLSSFDRSPESSGFILKYLQRTRETSVEDYQKLTTQLIRAGVDVQDIMELDQSLDQYVNEGLAKQSNTIQNRMTKLAEMLKFSNLDLSKGSERRQYLGGLTLVCPFGHKFNVEHSLQFAEANAGISQKDNIVKSYGPIITTQGDSNLKALLKSKHLVAADDPEMSVYTTKLPYEEWIKHPNGIVFPDFEDPTQPLLLFQIPVNLAGDIGEFVFYKKGQGWKDTIWESDFSYTSSRYEPRSFELSDQDKRAVSMFTATEEGEDQNIIDLDSASSWQIDENNPVADYDFNRPPNSSIPGADNLEDNLGNINPQAFDQRIGSFSRALKSVLRIITTWTKGLISTPMINSMLTDYTIDISRHADSITAPMLPFITMEDFDGEPLNPEKSAAVIQDIKNYMVQQVNRKGNALYDWIRSNIYTLEEDKDFDKQVAANILVAAMKDFNSFKEMGFDSDNGVAFMDIETLDKNIKSIAKKIVDSTPELVVELTLKSEKYYENVRRKAQYNGRINMVGYAQYLANVLPVIYRKYCQDEESYLYIGYNIGIDLSSPTKILGYEKDGKWIGGITEEQVDNITSSLKEAIEISGNFRKPKPQTLHYGHRIDRAWEELEAYLSRARKQAISGRAMELAKSYIIERISVMSGTAAEQIAEKIANSFPTRSLLFNGTTEEPETGSRLVSKRRLPYISGDILFTDLPGSKEVDEWIVRDKKSRTSKAFSSEQEARAYLAQAIEANPGIPKEQWVVEPDPYWINENNNFNSSKVQVGMLALKVTPHDFKWPPEEGAMDFAGINLPLAVANDATDASMSKAKNVPIPSFRFEIDFDGEPLDISFLFRRGRSDDDEKIIEKAEKFIINAVADSKRNLELFRQENAEAIRKEPEILAKATAQEEYDLSILLNPYLSMIDVIPLTVTTKKSYFDLTTKKPRPMLRIALEDPMRAYKLIMNPEVRGVVLTPGQKNRLVDFIIRVYNLNVVRDLARMQGGPYANLEARDLFEKIETMSFKFLGKLMKQAVIQDATGADKLGWAHDAGEYFDLIPGEKESDSGTYLQYVYKSSQNAKSTLAQGEHPDVKVLVTQGEVAAIDRRNMGQEGEKGEEAINNEFARKMEVEMLDYIKARTSGERKNDAKDGRKKRKHASEETEKISLRRSKLERSILSMGLDFDDVEVPQF